MSEPQSPKQIYTALITTKGGNKGTLQYHTERRVIELLAHSGPGKRVSKPKVVLSISTSRIVNLERPNIENYQPPPNPNGAEDAVRTGCFGASNEDQEDLNGSKKVSPRTEAVEQREPSSLDDDSSPPHSPLSTQHFSITFMPDSESDPKELRVARFHATCEPSLKELQAMFSSLESLVYPRGGRRMIAFVSPVSGTGKGQKLWAQYGQALVSRSRHTLTTISTTHRNHALEWCRDESNAVSEDDIIVAVGGDGMLWEVINGLKQRQRAQRLRAQRSEDGADSVPQFNLPAVGCFPTGSGCAMAVALDCLKFTEAALAAIRAETVPMNLMVATQAKTVKLPPSGKKYKKGETPPPPQDVEPEKFPIPVWSFMTGMCGFLAEIDRDSEKWRWMGNARFTAYAIQKMLSGVPTYKATIKYIPWKPSSHNPARPGHDWGEKADRPPTTMVGEGYRCTLDESCACQVAPPTSPVGQTAPAATKTDGSGDVASAADGFIELPDKDFCVLSLNNIPYIGRDMILAPFAHLGDGAIDLTYCGQMTRGELVEGLGDIEKGKQAVKANGKFKYVKASKILLQPHEGYVMFDGEAVPFHGYLLEVEHRGIRLIRYPVIGGHTYPKI